ncbi:EAL domain-containing protein [Phyllobacterium sp. YR531]|uniref:putative bifunctional diguanylate cyclase/phosphodiesterase n=1 Tax=Phyllobacterium sp. YR531 TaxID=1144343 RepID=UPI00026F6D37|nr:EAL domain-containing protein [Phyllobacterium sp. YR531]EJM98827.1 diguanylate cyclase (GGDEF) domain-containing protein [Phyllobacterium sp. YR531]
MLTVLSCLKTEHHPLPIFIAVIICGTGSLLAMRLFARTLRTSGASQAYWLVLCALVCGGTIWTTHFISMLGYKNSLVYGFDPALTLLSLGVSVLMAGMGLAYATLRKTRCAPEIGGGFMGFGIAIMHYIGMAAYSVSGRFVWDNVYVTASVLLAVIFGAFATSLVARPTNRFTKYGGAISLFLAICLLHFTGMTAVSIIPDSTVVIKNELLHADLLIAGISVIMAIILVIGAASYLIDLSSAQEAAHQYRKLAMHDALTGLANRAHLNVHLASILSSRPDNSRITVAVIDLDRFKEINDVHGHPAGDEVLREFSYRLRKMLGPEIFVARTGGDEFVAIQTSALSEDSFYPLGQKIVDIALQSIQFQGQDLLISASVGVAQAPEDGIIAGDLLSKADLALYRVKETGRNNHSLYEKSMDEKMRSRSGLAIDLKLALERSEFELYFQAQNDTQSREIVGFEALLRWRHPKRGMVSPLEFIPIAEETGLIHDIGVWVLSEACKEAATWNRKLKVAVNVAPTQLASRNLSDQVSEVLRLTGLEPERLELEITESGIIADQEHALQAMQKLKALGVKIAMDDYGTGYSSLSTLRNFPFDKIKIDREFIKSLNVDTHSAAIVMATLTLGLNLDIPVLAEGVETEDHIAFLSDAGCAEVQGFLFGRPIPQADLQTLMKAVT